MGYEYIVVAINRPQGTRKSREVVFRYEPSNLERAAPEMKWLSDYILSVTVGNNAIEQVSKQRFDLEGLHVRYSLGCSEKAADAHLGPVLGRRSTRICRRTIARPSTARTRLAALIPRAARALLCGRRCQSNARRKLACRSVVLNRMQDELDRRGYAVIPALADADDVRGTARALRRRRCVSQHRRDGTARVRARRLPLLPLSAAAAVPTCASGCTRELAPVANGVGRSARRGDALSGDARRVPRALPRRRGRRGRRR